MKTVKCHIPHETDRFLYFSLIQQSLEPIFILYYCHAIVLSLSIKIVRLLNNLTHPNKKLKPLRSFISRGI